MKKLILSIAIAVALTSCTADPIEMRQTNPQMGVNEVGTKYMEVTNGHGDTKTYTDKMIVQFNPKDKFITINDVVYEVVESTHYTITYLVNGVKNVIEFNTGYSSDTVHTITKFDVYQFGNKDKFYTVYTYKN